MAAAAGLKGAGPHPDPYLGMLPLGRSAHEDPCHQLSPPAMP